SDVPPTATIRLRASPRTLTVPATTPEPSPPPHAEYVERLAQRRAEEARLVRRERIIGNLRVAVFIPAAAFGTVIFSVERVAVAWGVGVAVVFLILLYYHQRTIRAGLRAQRAGAFYERGIARLEDRCSGTGE